MAVDPQHAMRTESVEALPFRFSARFHSALFYVRSGGRKNSRVRHLTGEGGFSWSLSRDGSQLALILEPLGHRVTFMAVSDRTTHEVEVNQWPLVNIDWASDGKSVLVGSRTGDGVPVILGVEPNGNHRVLLEGDRATQYWWVVESPDGRYVALTEVTGANNVWMVENF